MHIGVFDRLLAVCTLGAIFTKNGVKENTCSTLIANLNLGLALLNPRFSIGLLHMGCTSVPLHWDSPPVS